MAGKGRALQAPSQLSSPSSRRASASARTSSAGARIFLGVMLGLAYHLSSRVFANLGIINDWNAVISTAVPTAMSLALAAVGIWWVERR